MTESEQHKEEESRNAPGQERAIPRHSPLTRWPAPNVDDLKSAGCVLSPPNPALLCYLTFVIRRPRGHGPSPARHAAL
jgi:hypothetical protein